MRHDRISETMRRSARIKKIIETLKEKGNASTHYLSKLCDVSESTIRRDINFMAFLDEYKEIHRVHGGVVLKNNKMGLEYMFELKLNLNIELKQVIARKAVEYIEDGDSIILDSGTTCLYTARLLHKKNGLKVLTMDIKIADELGKYDTLESIIIGGLIRPGFYTIGGDIALSVLDQFNCEKAFLSADAVDIIRGITNASAFEVGLKRKIIESAKKVFLIADYMKFNKLAMYRVADLSRIHTVITNKELDPETFEKLTALGIEVALV